MNSDNTLQCIYKRMLWFSEVESWYYWGNLFVLTQYRKQYNCHINKLTVKCFRRKTIFHKKSWIFYFIYFLCIYVKKNFYIWPKANGPTLFSVFIWSRLELGMHLEFFKSLAVLASYVYKGWGRNSNTILYYKRFPY